MSRAELALAQGEPALAVECVSEALAVWPRLRVSNALFDAWDDHRAQVAAGEKAITYTRPTPRVAQAAALVEALALGARV